MDKMNAQYRIYVDSVIRLVTSIVLKDPLSAEVQNARLRSLGVAVDKDDPSTWRYYRNLQGLYHSTNTKMVITSLDTLEEIEFTKENLRIHRTTKKAYVQGNLYYQDLLDSNTSQESLIRGIVNPISLDKAFSAVDYTILSYDKTLVENHEVYLIPAIQQYIDMFFDRWYNQDYVRFEPNYHKLMMSTLYAQLIQEVLNQRNRHVNTIFVNSYHMRQYLSSFSRVGNEFEYMTHKQRLWLYRNIRYLNRNIGRQEIFEEVVDNVMTNRGFSLVRHDLRSGHEDLLDDLNVEVFTERVPLNNIPAAHGGNISTLKRVLDAELLLSRDNYLHRDETEGELVSGMQSSKYGKLRTKVLESSVLDRQDAEPFTLSAVLLNHWVFLSHVGYYRAVIPFHSPGDGASFRLSAEDAFIFYTYAVNKYHGIDLEFVPTVAVSPVRRLTDPTRQELLDHSDPAIVPEYFIDWLLDDQVQIGRVASVITFRELCIEIHSKLNRQRDARFYQQDYKLEGYLHTLMSRFIHGREIRLANNMPFDEWFDLKGIDISNMTATDYLIMSNEILTQATGAELNTASEMRSVHAAMLRMLNELTPYSVHVIKEINDSPLKIIDGKFPRPTIPFVETSTEILPSRDFPTINGGGVKGNIYVETGTMLPLCRRTDSHITVESKVNVSADINAVGSMDMTMYINTIAPTLTKVLPEVERFPDTVQAAYDGVEYPPLVTPTSLFKSGYTHLDLPAFDTYDLATESLFRTLLGV